MTIWMTALDKQPGVHLVGVKETWQCLFAKCILRIIGYKAITACKNNQLCNGLKAGIYRAVHGVQSLWEDNFSTDNWGFLLVDGKTRSTR